MQALADSVLFVPRVFTKLSPEEATAVATEGERFEIVEHKLVPLDLLHLPVSHGVPALRLPISPADAIFRRIRHRFSTLRGASVLFDHGLMRS